MSGMSPGGGQGPASTTGAQAPAVGPPTRPALSLDAVAALAAEAVGAGPGSSADTRLRAVREQRVLEGLAVAGDAPWAADLARGWATARQEALDLLAIHGQRTGRAHVEADDVLDALAVQLLTDPEAPGRLRRRLQHALAGQEPPPWFTAALRPEARVGRLLAAGLLLPEVQASAPAATADVTEQIPRVEQAWAPHDDHREAVQALLPGEGWWQGAAGWLSGRTGSLWGGADGLGGLLSGDDAPASRWQVVDASVLNVRAGPGTGEPVRERLPRGAVVDGTGRTESVEGAVWVELQLPAGGTGWAAGTFLTEVDG